jgi:hypothetical protein
VLLLANFIVVPPINDAPERNFFAVAAKAIVQMPEEFRTELVRIQQTWRPIFNLIVVFVPNSARRRIDSRAGKARTYPANRPTLPCGLLALRDKFRLGQLRMSQRPD